MMVALTCHKFNNKQFLDKSIIGQKGVNLCDFYLPICFAVKVDSWHLRCPPFLPPRHSLNPHNHIGSKVTQNTINNYMTYNNLVINEIGSIIHWI